MQRLVDKIVNEFQQNNDYIEIGALDGNGGDNLQLVQFQIVDDLNHYYLPVIIHRFFSSVSRSNKSACSISLCQRSAAPELFLLFYCFCAAKCDIS